MQTSPPIRLFILVQIAARRTQKGIRLCISPQLTALLDGRWNNRGYRKWDPICNAYMDRGEAREGESSDLEVVHVGHTHFGAGPFRQPAIGCLEPLGFLKQVL